MRSSRHVSHKTCHSVWIRLDACLQSAPILTFKTRRMFELEESEMLWVGLGGVGLRPPKEPLRAKPCVAGVYEPVCLASLVILVRKRASLDIIFWSLYGYSTHLGLDEGIYKERRLITSWRRMGFISRAAASTNRTVLNISRSKDISQCLSAAFNVIASTSTIYVRQMSHFKRTPWKK